MALSNDIQWGRYAECIFTNFDTKMQTTLKSCEYVDQTILDDGLRISFQYTKQRDETSSQSNGKITIYGLTPETFNRLGDRMRCEVELIAGYIKSKSNSPQRLFKAVLMDKSYEMQGDISVSTFTVWGDFQHKFVTQKRKMRETLPNPFFVDILDRITKAMGLDGFTVRLEYGNAADQDDAAHFLQKIQPSEFGYSMFGTPHDELKRLNRNYGLGYNVVNKHLVLNMSEETFYWMVRNGKWIRAAEESRNIKKESTDLVAEGKTTTQNNPKASSNMKIDIQKTHAVYLSDDNGLVGTPVIKTEIANIGYNANLQDNEEEWQKKDQKVLLDKEGKPRVDKKTGNVKLSKQAKTRKVARKNVVAKCLINSMIDYNSMVSIYTNSGITDGLYRVREIKIDGDTEGQNWYMELELNET